MEHKLITGGEQWLPFARSRIKALRATGLAYASQKFEVEGALIDVRIEPGHEYIRIEGGGPLWVWITLSKSVTQTSGVAGAHVPGSEAARTEDTTTKCWLLRSSLDFSASNVFYYGEVSASSKSTAIWNSADDLLERTNAKFTVVKGRLGLLKGFALYGADVILAGYGVSYDTKLIHEFHAYRDGAYNWEDSYDDSIESSRFLVKGVEFAGSTGGVATSHQYPGGGGPGSTSTFDDGSSGFFVREMNQTNDDFALIHGKIEGDDNYFKVPFDYKGGKPNYWQDPPDKLLELPHKPGYCQGRDVDWGVWITTDKYMGHPTSGTDRGKLWKFEVRSGVPHVDPPGEDTLPTEPIKTFDVRKLPSIRDNAELLEALNRDYASGGELSLATNPGNPSTAGFNRGYWQRVTPTGPNDNARTEGSTISVRIFMAPPRKEV